MNLRAIANAATQTINPNVSAVLRVSTGYGKDASFRQVPTYAENQTVTAQAQALTMREVQHLDSLNISNAVQGVYLNGDIRGLERVSKRGGDLLIYGGRTWLVIAVLEAWPLSGWCKVAVAEQMDV